MSTIIKKPPHSWTEEFQSPTVPTGNGDISTCNPGCWNIPPVPKPPSTTAHSLESRNLPVFSPIGPTKKKNSFPPGDKREETSQVANVNRKAVTHMVGIWVS